MCCPKKCLINSENQDMLKDSISDKSIIQVKNTLLDFLMSSEYFLTPSADCDHSMYPYGGTAYCIKAFSRLTGVSQYILSNVRADFNQGRRVKYEHGNKGGGRMTLASAGFVSWMKVFAARYGQDSPDEQLIILPRFV